MRPVSTQKPHPVDKGWAWMILLSSFGIHFLSIGYLRSFGLLFVEFQKKFGSSSAMTSVVSGVQFLSYSLATFLVVNVMMRWLSIRQSCLVGCVLEALGIILNGFVPNITLLILTQGVLFGSGQALLHCPTLIILSEYFEKKRAIATVIATMGVSAGGIVLPLLTRLLIDTYGLSGGLLVLAATVFHQAVMASLFTPPSDYTFIVDKEPIDNEAKYPKIGERYFSTSRSISREGHPRNTARNSQRASLLSNSGVNGESAEKSERTSVSKSRQIQINSKETFSEKRQGRLRRSEVSTKDRFRHNSKPLLRRASQEDTNNSSSLRKDKFHDNSVRQKVNPVSTSDSPNYDEEFVQRERLNTNDSAIFARNSQRKPSLNDTMSAVSTSSMDLYGSLHSFTVQDASLYPAHRSPSIDEQSDDDENEDENVKTKKRCHLPKEVRTASFWIVLVFFGSGGTASTLPPIFLPPLANEKGMVQHAALLLMISAVTEMAGRLIPGLILHFGFMRPTTVLILPMAACATLYQFTSFFNDFPTLVTLAALCGFFTGAFWAVMSLVVIEVFGMKKLGPILGFYNIVSGLSVAASNPIGGLLRDLTESYVTTFHYFGAMYYLATLMMILVQFSGRHDQDSETMESEYLKPEASPDKTDNKNVKPQISSNKIHRNEARPRNSGSSHQPKSSGNNDTKEHHPIQSPTNQFSRNSFSKSTVV